MAVTGGVCTGKSAVLGFFESAGAVCFSADRFAREVTQPDSRLVAKLVKLTGPGVTDASGALRRRELARRMFADTALRREVEALLHPPILRAMDEAARRAGGAVQCFEIPLLIECGLQNHYNRVVLCRCGWREQLRRLVERLEGDEALARRIIASQMTDSDRRPHADFVVMTNRPLEAVEGRVHRIFANLTRRLGVGV